jgi:hypothetical protein
MGMIAGIIASFAASHLGGMAIGGLLTKKGWLGFAGEAGKILIKKRQQQKHAKAAKDAAAWLKTNAGK